MFRLVLASVTALSIVTPALADMPPPEYDHAYVGKIEGTKSPTARHLRNAMKSRSRAARASGHCRH